MKKPYIFLLCFTILTGNVLKAQWNCGDTLVDSRDGKKYATKLFGTACWMKENLNYGTVVPSYTTSSTHSDMHNDGIAEKYCSDGITGNCATYGGLYEWDELMNYSTVAGGQGLCPAGWHVPTNTEWKTMLTAAGINLVGPIATGTGTATGANTLKALGTGIGSGVGTNTTGFTALPAGDRDAFGIFYGIGQRYIFWSSNEKNTNGGTAYLFMLYRENDTIYHWNDAQKITGLACRCVKNASTSVEELYEGYNPIEIYPDPATDHISLKIDPNNSELYFSIYNSMGSVVYEGIADRNKQISTNNLNSGLYYIRVKGSNNALYSSKFIIQ